MAETILVSKAILGRRRYGALNYSGQNRVILIREKHRFNIGILDTHVNHAVIFLILAGKLVLLYAAIHVIISMGTEYESVLSPAVHGLGIYIITRLRIPYKPPSLPPQAEILYRLVIHPLIVIRKNRVKINFRLRDMEQRLLTCHLQSLF